MHRYQRFSVAARANKMYYTGTFLFQKTMIATNNNSTAHRHYRAARDSLPLPYIDFTVVSYPVK